MSLARQILWPREFPGKLGRILGTLSGIGLAQDGFHIGLGPTLLLMLDWYDKFVGALLGWADPWIKIIVVWIAGWLNWNIVLYPHWRHIFVLLGLYCFRGAWADYADGNPITAAFRLFLGFIVVVTTSITVGVVPLTQGDLITNFLIAAVPILGIFFNDVILRLWRATFTRVNEARRIKKQTPTWWGYFGKVFFLILGRTIVSLAVVYFGLQIPIIQRIPSPGLAMLALLIVSHALHQLVLGARETKLIQSDGETWRHAFHRSRGTIIGFGILGVFWWVVIVCLIGNAGLQYFGL